MKQKARIYEQQKTAMQSGQAHCHRWVLDYEIRPTTAQMDNLTGWTRGRQGGASKLFFQSRSQAIAYATRRGLEYHLERVAAKKVRAKNYASNFKKKVSSHPHGPVAQLDRATDF